MSSTGRLSGCVLAPPARRKAAGPLVERLGPAKKESRRSGPGGGNTSTPTRANSARIWSLARRTVAVDARTFGRTLRPSTTRVASASMAVS